MSIFLSRKGQTLIIVALVLVVLFAIVGMVVDIGYMYVAKGQLQNAADAAALASAANLDGTNSVDQPNARNAAFTIASSNKVVPNRTAVHIGHPTVTIIDDNVLKTGNPGNDIVVGHWNGRFSFNNASSINAVQVRARRTEDSPGGQVDIFFGKVLALIGLTRWSKMSVAAEAVAAVVPAKILPIIVNEYWQEGKSGPPPPYGSSQAYPNSFVRVKNVDNSTSTMYGKIFAILGQDADDNVPASGSGGGSKNVNGFVDLDARSSRHDGIGQTWYSANTLATAPFTCGSCAGFFSAAGLYDPTSGAVNSNKFDTSLTYLLEGYPDNLPPPTVVQEQYRSNYTLPNYPLDPTSYCPYATIAYFSQSGKAPLNKQDANGQYFKDIYPPGTNIVTLVYDGTFNPTTDPSAPNAVTAVGYVALQIDGYSNNTTGLTTSGFLGSSGNTVYAHAISDIVDPYTLGLAALSPGTISSPGTCSPIIDAVRALQWRAGKVKLVRK